MAQPDYEQVIGLFRSRESAEKAAYYERIARHQCVVVVQA